MSCLQDNDGISFVPSSDEVTAVVSYAAITAPPRPGDTVRISKDRSRVLNELDGTLATVLETPTRAVTRSKPVCYVEAFGFRFFIATACLKVTERSPIGELAEALGVDIECVGHRFTWKASRVWSARTFATQAEAVHHAEEMLLDLDVVTP